MQSNLQTQDFSLHGADVVSVNILRVVVGTNGLHGGDAGYGSETVFMLENRASTDFAMQVKPNGIEIRVRGDTELHTLINALEFAAMTLRAQSGIEGVDVAFDYLEALS